MNIQTRDIRHRILEIAFSSGHGHIPTCFSVVEILQAIYSVMRHDARKPAWEDRDICILSKGHASLAHYCVLASQGYFEMDRVRTFGAFLSDFGCHADRLKVPGIEASTGSLGHGIGLAIGVALAIRMKRQKRHVYVIIGDGEANEGSVWEAVLVGAQLRLDNITIVYDNNHSHSRGLQIRNPAEKFSAFECDVAEVAGHDLDALRTVLLRRSDRPVCIIAETVKGYPCSTLINDQYAWHRRSPNEKEFQLLTEELDA